MSLEQDLRVRANDCCELCAATEQLAVYSISPVSTGGLDQSILACKTCSEQIDKPETTDANHWRCLNDSMWNPNLPVQIVAWRMLSRLRAEGWPNELKDMMYLDDDSLLWAQATGEHLDDSDKVIHRDANGSVLDAGDTVVLIKDLNVSGSSVNAKRGTAVRNISLDRDNDQFIEGKIGGQQIVLRTEFVKKAK